MLSSPDCLVAGHRGFKGKYPENTLYGFEKCFKAGATIFETDVWTTKDDVLVISHDVNTKRVFVDEDGNETNFNILESYYDDIKDLRIIGSNEKIITFKGLLRWFVEAGKRYDSSEESPAKHRIMLDIKKLNPPKILKLLVQDMLEVHNDLSWWFPRIQLGLWDLRFLKYLNQDDWFDDFFSSTSPRNGFKHFDIIHISVAWQTSMRFLGYNQYVEELGNDRFYFKCTAVSLIYISTWSTDFLTKFLPALKAEGLKLFSWTVNNRVQLEYLVTVGSKARLREYGVITDHPDKMVEFVNDVERAYLTSVDSEASPFLTEKDEEIHVPLKLKASNWLYMLVVNMFASKGAPPVSETSFKSYIDPDEITKVQVSKVWMTVFAACQKYGIF
ncbi:uncharacterized protein CXQ87_003157 [Candidozyma duobushaemuli]|uniref:GP-PDE domain-containing protein n=1 Tax=Candidozyma duobushaemuli TaxID=1231522 RepID=A0A2V1ABB2_9ASCO|nr:uncharacterized protein CXQ87_003157 [[Candida] duobushaemulonis]PVH15319.1 hypothetical protein CXQ87_003157 [[Candida] duobushaemulonis]